MGCAMTSLRTVFFSILMTFLSALGGSGASAATVQSYTIHAEGAFTSLHYGGLYAYDQATYAFQSHQDITFSNPGSASLAGHRLSASMRTTSGSAVMQYNPDGDMITGNATITGCTGFLSFLCMGGTQTFDVATQSLSSFTVNASLTTLSAAGLVYRSDDIVDWTSGTTSFFNSGGLETVGFEVSSLDIAPVPLPGGLALLLGGTLLLAGLRTRSALN